MKDETGTRVLLHPSSLSLHRSPKAPPKPSPEYRGRDRARRVSRRAPIACGARNFAGTPPRAAGWFVCGLVWFVCGCVCFVCGLVFAVWLRVLCDAMKCASRNARFNLAYGASHR